jgi:hypothetical protein
MQLWNELVCLTRGHVAGEDPDPDSCGDLRCRRCGRVVPVDSPLDLLFKVQGNGQLQIDPQYSRTPSLR